MQDAWHGRTLRSISKKDVDRGRRQGDEARSIGWGHDMEGCQGLLCLVRGEGG